MTNNFEYLLFDFDGTIFDTSPGIFESFDAVAKHYGINIDKNVYNKMIGPPLKYSFVEYFGLPESEVQNAIAAYRDFYSDKGGMFNCKVYDGVLDLLKKLRESGKKIFVATSKPEEYAKAILEKNGMLGLFDFVGGSDMNEKSRVEKVDVVNYVLQSQSIEDKKDSVLMIGDRLFDVNGAHSAGLKCLGILWGFGSQKELEDSGADFICETPEDVLKFLSN